MTAAPRFSRATPPQTPADVFRICDLDMARHMRTAMAEFEGLSEDDLPNFAVDEACALIRDGFLNPGSADALRRRSEYVAHMHRKGKTFEDFVKLHQRFQSLLLGSVLDRTSWYLGLGETGAGIFLRVMTEETLGMLKAFEAGRAEAKANRRKAREARLQASLGEVVRAAQDGDLSRRVPDDLEDPVLTAIGQDLNALLAVLSEGLQAAMAALGDMADGDLSARMEGDFSGEFATLQGDICSTVGAVAKALDAIREATDRIGAVTADLVQDAEGLKERTTEDRSNLERLNDAAGSLRGVLSANLEATSRAGRKVEDISRDASDAANGIRDLNLTMGKIEEGSSAVQTVTDLIDTIAHQTHLLSLNAAVEAARAGDAGRGFAVVATEVRALATRVAQGAEEIQMLVRENAVQVSAGRNGTDRVDGVLGSLLGQMDEMRRAFDDTISRTEAQAQQFAVMEETLKAMSTSSERNAEASRRGLILSETLAGAAQELTDAVDGFRDDGADASKPPEMPPAAPTDRSDTDGSDAGRAA